MERVLVTYATMAGSTSEVAQAVAEEITKSGLQVDLLPIDDVQELAPYDGVVVGGPMVMGWHRQARRFLKKHHLAFEHIPLALFVLAVSLTETGERSVDGLPVYVDDRLPKPVEGRLRFRDRYVRLANYLQPILNTVRPARPVSIGVFGGRLEYGRVPWWAVLFVMLVIQAPAGDRRNWPAIHAWAAALPAAFRQVAAVPQQA